MSKKQKTGLSAKQRMEENLKKLNERVDQLIEEHGELFDQYKKEEEWEMGIDEAGRGPTLGPMVYGTCTWPTKLSKELGKLGFADSKELSEQQRDNFFEIMQKLQDKLLHYEVKVISADEISNKMLGFNNYMNLNQISFSSAYHLINSLNGKKGFNITRCYVDTVGPSDTYQNKLTQDFASKYPNLKFTVTEKADSKFGIVSAASIGAKVTRDNEVKNFTYQENLGAQDDDIHQVGSGYPADPNTKKWLKKFFDPVFAYPRIVRYSWGTIQKKFDENKLEINYYEAEQGQQTLKFGNTQKKPYLLNNLNVKHEFDL